MKIPKAIKVLDVDYPIQYYDQPIDVDRNGKEELASQLDVTDGVIRVHRGERSWKAICQSLWVIVLEIICKHMIVRFDHKEETIFQRLAVGLNTVMFLFDDKDKGGELVDEEEEK